MQVTARTRIRARLGMSMLAAALLAGGVSCNPVAFLNNTASLGGRTPGSRGIVEVQFINNTPFRAIFTFGAYDPQDEQTQVQFEQFTVDADDENRLEGNTTSGVFTFNCARTVSIGGDRLIQLIQERGLAADPVALQPGITFSSAPLDSPDAAQPTAGRTPGVLTLHGVEFFCDQDPQVGSLLVYTFELDPAQPGGFRIDLQVILP